MDHPIPNDLSREVASLVAGSLSPIMEIVKELQATMKEVIRKVDEDHQLLLNIQSDLRGRDDRDWLITTVRMQSERVTNLEIKLNVANRTTAKSVANKWSENAAEVFYALHEKLVE